MINVDASFLFLVFVNLWLMIIFLNPFICKNDPSSYDWLFSSKWIIFWWNPAHLQHVLALNYYYYWYNGKNVEIEPRPICIDRSINNIES